MDRRTKGLLVAILALLAIAIVVSGTANYQQGRMIGAEVRRIEQKLDSMLEEPAPVTEETAAAIATEFGDLKEVTGVAQPRVISQHTETFNVRGNDGQGDILIGVDPTTGEVIKMVLQCPYAGRDSEIEAISGEEAVKSAQEFLSKRGLPPVPEGFVVEEPRLRTTWTKKHWEVVWHHRVDEIAVLPDFLSFLVNAETGLVVSYSKVRHDIEVARQPRLTADEAIERARAALGKGTLEGYDPAMQVLKTTLKVLYPNNYFEDFVYHWSDRQALAWVVQFEEDEDEPAIDVWIDAFSGDLLGGEIYERPVPELWGVPNQTADITNIWQPALDLMQYDTSGQTFLGDATEADVVNSIANGFIFILQTHGGTTATAEEAVISNLFTASHDARHLDPSEVPANDLRYALVSCCNSGHDGSGTDFKDAFIDQGADVFQGYVESINPDPYEMSLRRYLAEGDSLWNAHWNAVADVNPWFTIVIEYGQPLYCYNLLRLAPLHVDVSASSAGWHTATIEAQVRNREDARHTTATNVMAQLQLPPGVAIVSGANPQTTSALNYNHNWTAQWTVVAPLFSFGTKTFDVLVWSDNLGVAVDDYDDPYHKVDASFAWSVTAVVKGYLQVVKWWELAQARYADFPQPEQIISLSGDLDRYQRAEDVQEDPEGFLRIVTDIAQLEVEFGNRLVESGEVTPEAAKGYLEAVEAKTQYLRQLQETGLEDSTEVLTELSAMQMRINAAALSAFWED